MSSNASHPASCMAEFPKIGIRAPITRFFVMVLDTISTAFYCGCSSITTTRMLYLFGPTNCYVVVDLPLLRVALEGSDNPISLEKPCQASLPPDQQGHHSLGRHPEVQYAV